MTLRDFLIRNQLLSLAIYLVIAGCSSTAPKWDGKLYAGDSAKDGISRAQSQETIACNTPAIDKFICMTQADFKTFYATYVLGCKDWWNKSNLTPVEHLVQSLEAQVKKE